MSDHGRDNDSHYGKNDNMGDVNYMHMIVIAINGAIWLPHILGRAVFQVIKTILQLLQVRGMFGVLAHEYPHEHLQNFEDICWPFSFKNISQELVRLWLFPFSLMGEDTKWLADLPWDSITSWD